MDSKKPTQKHQDTVNKDQVWKKIKRCLNEYSDDDTKEQDKQRPSNQATSKNGSLRDFLKDDDFESTTSHQDSQGEKNQEEIKKQPFEQDATSKDQTGNQDKDMYGGSQQLIKLISDRKPDPTQIQQEKYNKQTKSVSNTTREKSQKEPIRRNLRTDTGSQSQDSKYTDGDQNHTQEQQKNLRKVEGVNGDHLQSNASASNQNCHGNDQNNQEQLQQNQIEEQRKIHKKVLQNEKVQSQINSQSISSPSTQSDCTVENKNVLEDLIEFT